MGRKGRDLSEYKTSFVNEPSPEAVDNWFRLYLRILCEKVWNRKYYSRT